MQNTKHTPGPWSVDPNGQCINYQNPILGESFFLKHEPFVPGFKNEQKANMALVSAAPDLLDSISAIVEFLEKQYPWQLSEPLNGLLTSCRAAILKATKP